MPSPFPGMDPFLERQEWEDFHTTFNTVVRESLAQALGPGYVGRVERRVHIEHLAEEAPPRRADGAMLWTTVEVVTVLETLSPANKRLGSDGRREYLSKREATLRSQAHLVELDLLRPCRQCCEAAGISSRPLRGGARLPMVDSLPPGDDYAIVSRQRR